MLLDLPCLPCYRCSHQHSTILMGQLRPSRFFVMFLSGRKLVLNHAVSDLSYLDVMALIGASHWPHTLIKSFIACYFWVSILTFFTDAKWYSILLLSLLQLFDRNSSIQSSVRRCFVHWGFLETHIRSEPYSYYYLPFVTTLWGVISFEFDLSSARVTF